MANRRGKKKADPRVVAAAIALQAAVGALTVRDVRHRPADRVRGPKWLWYAWGGSNTGGAMAYWLVGRRR